VKVWGTIDSMKDYLMTVNDVFIVVVLWRL
jgi:hypothetical protein